MDDGEDILSDHMTRPQYSQSYTFDDTLGEGARSESSARAGGKHRRRRIIARASIRSAERMDAINTAKVKDSVVLMRTFALPTACRSGPLPQFAAKKILLMHVWRLKACAF